MLIENTKYKIEFDVSSVVCVRLFGINPEYRGRGYSYLAFDFLKRKYSRPIVLECWPTLLEFYSKLGFREVCRTVDGYVEMELL